MSVYVIYEQHHMEEEWPYRFQIVSGDGDNLIMYSRYLAQMHEWCHDQYGSQYGDSWCCSINLFRFKNHYQATEFKLRWK